MAIEITRREIFEYYSRPEIAAEIVRNARHREVAGAFFDGSYDARPNTLQFPSDVIQMARRGVTSFHYSVEHWQNPMAIVSGNYNSFRSGWDIIIDIDSKLGIDESKIAAAAIIDALGKYGIRNTNIKFSGRRGFHICLPWVMFPKEINYEPLAKLYPQVPRAIVSFIKEQVKDEIMRKLLQQKSAKELIETLQEPPSSLSPYFFLEIENNWGARHMFRAPYSLNEKTWLVSLPITEEQLDKFSPEMAAIKNIQIKTEFFKGDENEAENLLIDALDWETAQKKEEIKEKPKKKIDYEKKIPEEFFPPCMTVALAGMADGRKRALYTLISFLRMCNWAWPEIEAKIMEWNERNKPPLARNIVVAQLRWGQANARNPWNCPPEGQLYVDIGICRPDNICRAGTQHIVIKNPIVYPFKKMGRGKKSKKAYRRGYSCMHCDREFETERSLTMHKSRSHGISDGL